MANSVMNFNKFEKKGNLWYAKALTIVESMKFFPYGNVSDEIIKTYLISGQFIDTMDGNHLGCRDSLVHHAQRIASLINLIQTGVSLDPITIYCNYIDDEVFNIEGIDDGFHRLRASCYLDQPIRFILEFNE